MAIRHEPPIIDAISSQIMTRIVAALLVAAASIGWPTPPPAPPSVPAINVYFGKTVVDPYRNLEDLNDPAVQRFLRQQDSYARGVLAKLGARREEVRASVTRRDDVGSTVSNLARAGGRLFYLARPPDAEDARLMVADERGKAAPRLLLAPDSLEERASKVHFALTNVVPSPDGKFVAVGVVPDGAENETETRIIRVADGTLLPDDLPRTWFGVSAWSPDDKSVFYNQLRALRPGEPEQDRELRSLVYRHVVGSDLPDVPVFGYGVDEKLRFQPIDLPFVVASPTSAYAFGVVLHGSKLGEAIYVAPLDAVLDDTPIPWRKIVESADQVTNFDVEGSTVYMLCFKGASKYKIVALDVGRTNQRTSDRAIVVPPSDIVLQQVAVAQDGLYVRGILAGQANLRKLPFNRDGSLGHLLKVALPSGSAVAEFATDPNTPGAVLGLVSWTKPLSVYALSKNGALADMRIRKPPMFDTSQYVSLEVTSKSVDGTRVPLSIIMRRGTRLDGSHATYIEVFGAFGENIDPYFLGPRLAWLDYGGVWAVAHVRGGGENGEDWHRAGAGAAKEHSVQDAIGAARYLISHGYTSSEHLGIGGASAGGIVVGGALNEHPELFAAALDSAAVTNPLRLEAADPNGPANAHEYGSLQTQTGFDSILRMDPYQHIATGRSYPGVLAVTGMNDPLVAPWQSAKFVARLQAASSSGRPILLRVDYDAGHGLRNASHSQIVNLMTDELSFLLWQCGSPLFAGVSQRPR